MKVLAITSSILKDFSVSNVLVKDAITHFKSKYPDISVVTKNVGEQPPAHLSLEFSTAIRSKDPSTLTPVQQQAYQEILTSIDELKAADVIIIGAPMHNLGITSGLKNWIDQICQAGLTFKYTEKGAEGLVKDKSVIILSSCGGVYSSAPFGAFYHQLPYLKAVLGFIGITDIKTIRAEGLNISPEMKEKGITAAKLAITTL